MNIRFNDFFDGEYPFSHSSYPNLVSINDFTHDKFRAIKDTLIYHSNDYCSVLFHAVKSHLNHLSFDCEFINNQVFRNSEKLEKVILKKILKIPDNAFSGCSKLKELYVSDKLVYFKNQDDYNFDKIYVLNNESSVIEMLVENGFPREIISSWELPLTTIDFNAYIINHLGFNYIRSIIISSFSLFFLSSISSFFKP